jgi:hypothetical protein
MWVQVCPKIPVASACSALRGWHRKSHGATSISTCVDPGSLLRRPNAYRIGPRRLAARLYGSALSTKVFGGPVGDR